MASKKLTTDEVNALMEGLAQSSSQSTVDIAGSDEVRPFTFGEDDLSLMGDYYALRQVNERFARLARSVFLPMLRLQPRITPFPPEVKSFDEYTDSIDNFMNLNISRIEELRGPMLMAIQPEFISTLTAAYYGGDLGSGGGKRAEFTATEERVIELVSEGLMMSLSSAWRDLMPITLVQQGREINTQFASVVDGSELVIICSFVIQLPDKESDKIDIVYPLQTLKPIAAQLRSRVQSDSLADDVSWREKIEKAILDIPLELSALLGRPSLSVGSMTRLVSGDVIPLEVGGGITIKIEDKPVFIGEVGEVSGKAAISLTKRVVREA
ncbi:MAG: flagellar motor switch protein FliM [Candidatus Puniceispirillaceae bacterium]